jgi:hypothetical protein
MLPSPAINARRGEAIGHEFLESSIAYLNGPQRFLLRTAQVIIHYRVIVLSLLRQDNFID